MARRLGAFPILLLLATVLAGCASPPPPPAAPVEEEAPPEAGLVASQDVANITQAEDQSDFAKSLDEKFHTHDYWDNSLEKLLMDADVASAPLVPFDQGNPFESMFRLFFRFGFGGAGFTPFELPEGSIIPPEAERVEVTITWPDSPTITGLSLAYQTAYSKDIEVLDTLPAGGGTYVIPTNVTNNDQPHTAVSKWRFFLLPDSDTGPGLFNGTAHVAVKAFRNDTLFVAPPHPDFWVDATTLTILEVNGTLACTRAVFPIFLGGLVDGVGCDEGFAFLELPNGTIIPPHTGVLTLELTWQSNPTVPDPFRTRPDLVYTPANTRRFIPPEGQQVEEGRAVYTVAVDPKMVDSPYAEESEWAFVLFLRSEAPTDNGFFGGVGDFQGTYALRILAEREQV